MKKLFWMIAWIGLAASATDCNIRLPIMDLEGTIFSADDMKLTVNLLQSACVSKGETSEKEAIVIEEAMDSTNFIDHCVSVGVRKLDADKDFLYRGQVPSSTGMQRNTVVKTFISSPTAVPGTLRQQYEQMFLPFQSEYESVCQSCIDIYEKYYQTSSSVLDLNVSFACNQMISNHLSSIQRMVFTLESQKKLEVMQKSWRSYLSEYAGGNKMIGVLEKLTKFVGGFNLAAQQTTEGTRNCN